MRTTPAHPEAVLTPCVPEANFRNPRLDQPDNGLVGYDSIAEEYDRFVRGSMPSLSRQFCSCVADRDTSSMLDADRES